MELNKIYNIDCKKGLKMLSENFCDVAFTSVMKYEVAEWFINNFTKKGEVIIDPFMGCGTTAIACENLGRNWLGFEICKEYVDMANERIEKATRQFKIEL